MKRVITLLLLLVAMAGCSAGNGNNTDGLSREAILPDDYVSRIAGVAMKQVFDLRDEGSGIVRWAWEETEGTPKLLVVEICFSPEDCDGMYNKAQSGALSSAMAVPSEAVACYDGRAAHIRFGKYYVRAAILGVGQEKAALELISTRLITKLNVDK